MKYRISENDGRPAYLQLYSQLRDDIVSGAYPFGAKLPSKRLFAEETGVSVITVEHAYGLLCEEGYAESRERSGYFIIYRQDDFISRGSNSGAVFSYEDLSAAHGVPFSFPFTVLAKTMRKVLSDHGERIFERSPNKGCLALRQALSQYIERSAGISVSPDAIIVGAGAEYLYGLVVQLFGKRVYAIEKPSYKKIRQVYEAHGATCDPLELHKDGISSASLRSSKATVLHVTPFNSFPSHITASASKRREYLRWAKERGGYIVEDNYDSELTVSTKNEETLFSLDSERVVYLNTFSRTVAPSVRVGYMVLPESKLNEFEEKLGFYSCTVPVFEQLVLAELINGGEFERYINRVRRAKRKLSK